MLNNIETGNIDNQNYTQYLSRLLEPMTDSRILTREELLTEIPTSPTIKLRLIP